MTVCQPSPGSPMAAMRVPVGKWEFGDGTNGSGFVLDQTFAIKMQSDRYAQKHNKRALNSEKLSLDFGGEGRHSKVGNFFSMQGIRDSGWWEEDAEARCTSTALRHGLAPAEERGCGSMDPRIQWRSPDFADRAQAGLHWPILGCTRTGSRPHRGLRLQHDRKSLPSLPCCHHRRSCR